MFYFYRNMGFIVAVSFSFCTQAIAMYGSQSGEEDESLSRLHVYPQAPTDALAKKEIEKIEKLLEALRGINPINFDFQEADNLLEQQAPDYSLEPEKVINFYQSVTKVAGGGRACVWKATLKEDRSQAGLKAGDTIAIRMVAKSRKKPLERIYKGAWGFDPLIRGSHLRNPKDKKTITEYFPNFYGIYYGPAMPQKLVKGSYFEIMKTFQDWVYRYEEMEWVDTTFEEKFNQNWIAFERALPKGK